MNAKNEVFWISPDEPWEKMEKLFILSGIKGAYGNIRDKVA